MINTSLIELYANPEERIIFINEILEKGKVSDYELRFKVKDGSVKYLSLSSNISARNFLEECLKVSSFSFDKKETLIPNNIGKSD
jgi:hypothetical protein